MVEAYSGNGQKIVVVSLAWMPTGVDLPWFKKWTRPAWAVPYDAHTSSDCFMR